MKGYFQYAFLVFLFTIISCRTTKQVEYSGPAPQRTQSEVLKSLSERVLSFEFFSAKGKSNFESSMMSGSGGVQLRVKKDNAIWFVAKKFSIEGLRALINKDSIYVVNRIEKTFVAESINNASRTLGIDLSFDDIQNLFVGNVFIPTEENISSFKQNDKDIDLTFNVKALNIKYNFNAYNLSLEQVQIRDRSGNTMVIKFGNYKKLKKNWIAYKREISITSISGEQSSLTITLDEIELNIEKSLIFNLPLHYERIRL